MGDKDPIQVPIQSSANGTFHDRLLGIIGKQSIREFAAIIGVSEGTVRNYLKGASPKIEQLAAIAEVGGVSLDWLITGKEYEGIGKTPQTDGLVETCICRDEFDEEYALIPGYHVEVSTGSGCAWNGEEVKRHLAFRTRWLRYRRLKPEHLRVVFAKGDSMEPTIHNGDSILVDVQRTQLEDGSIFVMRLGEDLYAKRLQKRFDGGVEIISDNKEYDKQVVGVEDLPKLQIIGKVVWVGKDIH